MNWREDFGDDFKVPKWFDDHPDLVDMSGKNDEMPTFVTREISDPPETTRVRIFVAHEDPDEREYESTRFWMEFMEEIEEDDLDDNTIREICIIVTDDLQLIKDLLPWAQGVISKYGRDIWRTSTGPFPWKKGCVFDTHGKPTKPGVPMPSDLGEAKSDEVDRALEAINLQRASIGMGKLDPGSAGWSDQDILDEAARIRLKNGLLAM